MSVLGKARSKPHSVKIYITKETLDKLHDSFIHLINNSIEHGIKTDGNLTIQCYRKKQQIVFRLKDGAMLCMVQIHKLLHKKKLPFGSRSTK